MLVVCVLAGCALRGGPMGYSDAPDSRFVVNSGAFSPTALAGKGKGCHFNIEALDKQSKASFGIPVVAKCVRSKADRGKTTHPKPAHALPRQGGGGMPAAAPPVVATVSRRLEPAAPPVMRGDRASLLRLATVDAHEAPLPMDHRRRAPERPIPRPRHHLVKRLPHKVARKVKHRTADPVIAVASAPLPESSMAAGVPVHINLPQTSPTSDSDSDVPVRSNFKPGHN